LAGQVKDSSRPQPGYLDHGRILYILVHCVATAGREGGRSALSKWL
jgi:hypothetical protein